MSVRESLDEVTQDKKTHSKCEQHHELSRVAAYKGERELRAEEITQWLSGCFAGIRA